MLAVVHLLEFQHTNLQLVVNECGSQLLLLDVAMSVDVVAFLFLG